MHKVIEPIQYVSDQLLAQIAALCKPLPKVVVVGAGPGGLNLARGLKGHADVTLVDG
jgi:NADPH-dependent 2,4-dienoyl-CoA reductase/sulfur reductase-like enzyme